MMIKMIFHLLTFVVPLFVRRVVVAEHSRHDNVEDVRWIATDHFCVCGIRRMPNIPRGRR